VISKPFASPTGGSNFGLEISQGIDGGLAQQLAVAVAERPLSVDHLGVRCPVAPHAHPLVGDLLLDGIADALPDGRSAHEPLPSAARAPRMSLSMSSRLG
jgi:hypothetical protein